MCFLLGVHPVPSTGQSYAYLSPLRHCYNANNIRDLNIFALIALKRLNTYFECELLQASWFFSFTLQSNFQL